MATKEELLNLKGWNSPKKLPATHRNDPNFSHKQYAIWATLQENGREYLIEIEGKDLAANTTLESKKALIKQKIEQTLHG